MYTTTCTRIIRTNNLVFLGLAALLLVVGVRLVNIVSLITIVTMIALVTLTLILFLQIMGIGITLLRKHLTLMGWWLLGLRMHWRLRC